MAGILWAVLWFSWIGVVIAAVPTGIWVLVSSYSDITRRMKVAYVAAGLLGGVAGESVAVGSLFLATEWACWRGEQVCHDGQTGMVLILTVPLFSLIGCLLSLILTRVSFRSNSDRVWASVFVYNGPNRGANWVTRLGIHVALWSTLLGVVTLLSIRVF